MKIDQHSAVSFEYKLELIRSGKTVAETPFVPHLLTDAGLDAIGANGFWQSIQEPHLGTAATPTPIRRNGGAVTFTQTGTTLTASGNFFEAADVGRLFKWGADSAGVDVYISAFVSATQVTVATSAEVATATAGVVWYVNTSALGARLTGITYTQLTGATETCSTYEASGNTLTVTFQMMWTSSAFASGVTLSEIGFSTGAATYVMTDRDVISPTVGALTGDQAKITARMIVKYSGIEAFAVGNIGTGFDASGTAQYASLAKGGPEGAKTLNNCMDMVNVYYVTIMAFSSAYAFVGFDATGAGKAVTGTELDASLGAYTAGSHYRDKYVTFPIASANHTINGFAICPKLNNLAAFVYKLATPIVKANTQTLYVAFRQSWSRILTN